MGGSPEEHPERYALGSPAEQLPLGIPQLLVHGRLDTTVPPTLSEDYAARARAAGDDARDVELDAATHMDMISRDGAAFGALAECLNAICPPGSLR
jgi:pimeloyl-ACP methyl ester carboxylesterase